MPESSQPTGASNRPSSDTVSSDTVSSDVSSSDRVEVPPLTESVGSSAPASQTGEGEGSVTAEKAVRVGSPFAESSSRRIVETNAFRPSPALEALDPEWGVLRSAIWASAWVAIFSIACYQFFPGGGVVVAALGCGLAIIGLFSSRPIPATVLLMAHAVTFFGCYQRLF